MFSGKTSVIKSAATVNKTMTRSQRSDTYSQMDSVPSAENGPKSMAQNTVYQYGHAGLVNAMRSGETAAMIDVMRIR